MASHSGEVSSLPSIHQPAKAGTAISIAIVVTSAAQAAAFDSGDEGSGASGTCHRGAGEGRLLPAPVVMMRVPYQPENRQAGDESGTHAAAARRNAGNSAGWLRQACRTELQKYAIWRGVRLVA